MPYINGMESKYTCNHYYIHDHDLDRDYLPAPRVSLFEIIAEHFKKLKKRKTNDR